MYPACTSNWRFTRLYRFSRFVGSITCVMSILVDGWCCGRFEPLPVELLLLRGWVQVQRTRCRSVLASHQGWGIHRAQSETQLNRFASWGATRSVRYKLRFLLLPIERQ